MGTQQVIQLFQSLSNDLQREVVDFMEFLLVKREKADMQQPLVRRPGTLAGFVVYMAPDFDAPLEDVRQQLDDLHTPLPDHDQPIAWRSLQVILRDEGLHGPVLRNIRLCFSAGVRR